jgi:starch synthase
MFMRKQNILIAASEAVPFVKTGGLADVCGALPKALKQRGHDARLVLPRYWAVDINKYPHKHPPFSMGVHMGDRVVWCKVYMTETAGVKTYLIEHDHYFGRAGLYDDNNREYLDNAERFSFFSRAALQLCKDIDFQPDVIHCNDWQTGLIPAYLKTWDRGDVFFNKTASVFTIHNIGHQGVFKAHFLPFIGLWPSDFIQERFEAFGDINIMKGAIYYADCISTVSPEYASEILGPIGGSGLNMYLARRKDDLTGILNGADYDHWDPEHDRFIPARYSGSALKGKGVCKQELQKEFMLEQNPGIPIIGVVSRFAGQKGMHILMLAMKEIMQQMRAQFVFVGCGEKYLEDFFGGLPAKFPGKIGAWIGYNNEKAHRIEAGSDFFLMPSLYEPCGLNQIYSMKYATLPIVRATGGLKDTVRQYNEATGDGTGFLFDAPTPEAVRDTVGWAVSTYYDRKHHFQAMRKRAMKEHFSWDDSAKNYEKLYQKALARRASWS